MTTLGRLAQRATQQPRPLLVVPVKKSLQDVVTWLDTVSLRMCLTAEASLIMPRTDTQRPSATCLRV